MNILSFSRMKLYREGGRVAVVLKLCLPRMCDEGALGQPFNDFYIRLAEKYALSAGKMEKKNMDGARPVTVSVGFSVINEKYICEHKKIKTKHSELVVIERNVLININGSIKRAVYTDVYNFKDGIFIK